MEQSHSWEANSHSASQEIPRIVRISEVHYRVHNISLLFRVLSQMNPVHNLPTVFP